MSAFGLAGVRPVDCALEAANGLFEQLDRHAPVRGGLPLSAPKRIAGLALYLRWASGCDAETALQSAMATLAGQLNCTRTAFKKASSEARAILQFGLPDFVLPQGGDADDALREIAAALHPVNTRMVTQARAMALGGVRGGRPSSPRPRPAHAAVSSLIEQALAGDAEALAELAAIEGLIRAVVSAGHRADRLEATL